MMERKIAWWDKLGKPQYGGEMSLRINSNITNYDPYVGGHHFQVYSAWMEQLHTDDWTTDPAIYEYKIGFPPNQFVKGELAESWEFPDPSTCIIHLRKGIHWQDIPPVNGREFVADDVAYHYHRMYGIGSGFTKPAPGHVTYTSFKNLISVTAIDKYTAVFKWKTHSIEFIMQSFVGNHSPVQCIEAPEAVQKWKELNDWHRAIGTGAFILQEYLPGSSATLVKNPNYWGHDERYPENKLPYVNKLKFLVIPDDSEAMEAMRGGKIDVIEGLSFQQAQAMQKTNPELKQFTRPRVACGTIDPRNDRPPFNDIRVRKAMQMAIDLSAIVGTYYGGFANPYPQTLTSSLMKEWGFPYGNWPSDLKDEYAYNPSVAKKLLADAGFPNGFKTNVIANAAQPADILMRIKYYFAAVGIDMEIKTMDSVSYTANLTNRIYDQMVDNTNEGTLGMVNEPLYHLQRFQTGFKANCPLVSDPVFDAFYPKAIASTSEDQLKTVLKKANERVARQHYAISLVQPYLFGFTQPWLKGYTGQFGAQPNHNQLLSFYLARFWIDQNLKKAMMALIA
jgi:peptide/nickel transport system substrate-binding protein